MEEQDYVLGTHDDELTRLGLQHEVWRPHALEACLIAERVGACIAGP